MEISNNLSKSHHEFLQYPDGCVKGAVQLRIEQQESKRMRR